MAKWSSQHNGKYPDPYAKLKFDNEKKKEKKKKKQKREKENVLAQIDPNANKVSSDLLLLQLIHSAVGLREANSLCF